MTVTAQEGSLAAGVLLGGELRRLREAKGLTREQVARHLDCTTGKVSHFENWRYPVRRPDLESVCRLYGVPERFEELDAIRRVASQPGWWARYDLPTWLSDLIGFEESAKRERVCELDLIPALLQTEGYAYEIQNLGTVKLSPAELDKRVAVRIERQKRLRSNDPLELCVVISETALLRAAANPTVAAGQLRKLVDDAQLSNVSLRVLPISAGLHAASGAFTVLDFAPDVPLKVAYEESALGGRLLDKVDAVQALSDLHDELRSQALSETESLALLTQLSQQTN